MRSEKKRQQNEAELVEGLRRMHGELHAWREQHPEASFDEIAAQVTPRRRELVAILMRQLAEQHGNGVEVTGVVCPDCGHEMTYRGAPSRDIEHYLEGETEIERAYYYCEHCRSGFFPPGQATSIGEARVDTGDDREDGATGG